MWKNIVGSVSYSFGLSDYTSNLVITWGLCNSFSRIIMGTLSDLCGKKVCAPLSYLDNAVALRLIQHLRFHGRSGPS
jgi:hypothetical protein